MRPQAASIPLVALLLAKTNLMLVAGRSKTLNHSVRSVEVGWGSFPTISNVRCDHLMGDHHRKLHPSLWLWLDIPNKSALVHSLRGWSPSQQRKPSWVCVAVGVCGWNCSHRGRPGSREKGALATSRLSSLDPVCDLSSLVCPHLGCVSFAKPLWKSL